MNELQPIPRSYIPTSALPLNTIDVTPGTVSGELPGPGLKRDYAGVLEYWQMVRRHKGAVILATFLGAMAGFLMTLSDPRVYQARTSLEIQGLNEEFLNMKSVNPLSETSNGYLDTDIQTQVKLLQSRGLLERVQAKLDAGKHL